MSDTVTIKLKESTLKNIIEMLEDYEVYQIAEAKMYEGLPAELEAKQNASDAKQAIIELKEFI